MPLHLSLRVTLVRHGESANNSLGQQADFDRYMLDRVADPVLTETGVQQAQLAADYLAAESQRSRELSVSHIFCSPMWRTLQTTRPISQALQIDPEVWIDLHEQGGIFQRQPDGTDANRPGATRSEILENFPNYKLPDSITEQGWWTGGHEGMSPFLGRAIRLAYHLRDLASAAAHGRKPEHFAAPEVSAPDRASHYVIVTHGILIDALLKGIFYNLPAYYLYYDHNNTGMTRLDFFDDSVRMLFQNRVNHLTPEMITM